MELYVITGPMFAGKSTELIRNIERAALAKKKAVVFKPDLDNRYSTNEVVTHSNLRYRAFVIPSSKEGVAKILEIGKDFDTIGIDEAQFLPLELVDVCEKLLKLGKDIYLSALNLDFKGQPFETTRELLVRADFVLSLSAICVICGREATKTQRLIDGIAAKYDTPRILVSGKELYQARCNSCFIIPDKNQTSL